METYAVGKTSQVSPNKPYVVNVEGRKVGIYKLRDGYVAYENECCHEGGPVVEGELIGHYECEIAADGRRLKNHFSNEKFDIVCPWHGIQYDLETGICTGDKSLRLNSIDVIVEGDDIKLKM